MRLPPCVVSVRVDEGGRTRFRLWLPVLLLWPLMLVLGILGLVAAALVDAVLLAAGRRPGNAALLLGSVDALCETRGVEVEVNDQSRTVAVAVR